MKVMPNGEGFKSSQKEERVRRILEGWTRLHAETAAFPEKKEGAARDLTGLMLIKKAQAGSEGYEDSEYSILYQKKVKYASKAKKRKEKVTRPDGDPFR